MGWFRRKPIEDIPDLEEPVWEPVLGPFDHPHRIRDAEVLAEQYAEPLPPEAAARALRHLRDTNAAEQAWRDRAFADGGPGPIDAMDGIFTAEVYDPDVQKMVADHEERMRIQERMVLFANLKPWQTRVIDVLDRAHAAIEKRIARL